MQAPSDHRLPDMMKGYWKLVGVMKKNARRKPRLTLQKGFYKWLVLSKPRKTKSIAEKFYFNSKLNPIKTLWLIKTMYLRDLERHRIDPKVICFLESVIKSFEFLRIKTLRQPFSRISQKDDLLLKRLLYIAETSKRLQSFKLREFLANLRGKHRLKRVVDGVLLLQKYKDKLTLFTFSTILGHTRSEHQAKARGLSLLVGKILQACRSKKSHAIKGLARLVQNMRVNESLFTRLAAIIKTRQSRHKKDALIAVLIYANVQAKIIAGKDAALNIAFKRLEQAHQKASNRALGQVINLLKQRFLTRFDRIRDVLNAIRRSYRMKTIASIGTLRATAKNRSQTAKLPFLRTLDTLLKRHKRLVFDKIRYRAESKLVESYYHMMQSNRVMAESENLPASRKTGNVAETNLRSFCTFFERLLKEKMFRNKILIFNKLKSALKKRKIMFHKTRDEQVIKNTIIMSNLLKALMKKQLITKFLHFKVWERYAAFLRQYAVKGIHGRQFFEILAKKQISFKTILPDSMTPTASALMLRGVINNLIIKRKRTFLNQCKLLLVDKAFHLYVGFALLTRNIYNRRVSGYLGKLSGRNMIFVRQKEGKALNSNGKASLNKSFRSRIGRFRTPGN